MRLELLSIDSLGSSGINTDMAGWSLPPEFITDGINFRVVSNKLISTSKEKIISTLPVDIEPAFLMRVSVADSDLWLICGNNAVYAFNGSSFADVSSVIGYAALSGDLKYDWKGVMLGQIPIINHQLTGPEFWSPAGLTQVLQPLDFLPGSSWSQQNKFCKVMRAHKNFLFALDLVEGGTNFPSAYRWSHPADINGLPFTWDETDLSSLAGRAQIGGDSGRLIDGKSLRDAFCLYSDRGINLLELSNDEFVWRRRELSTTYGLVNANSIAEVKGVHYFLSDGDIMRNDGNSITSIAHDRIKRRIAINANTEFYKRSYVVRETLFKEIWFCVPEGSSQVPNIAYVWNWADDSWSIRSIPNNIAFSDYGPQGVNTVSYADVTESYEDTLLTYGTTGATPLDDSVVGIDQVTGSLVNIDSLSTFIDAITTTFNNTARAFVERTNLPILGKKVVTSIMRIYPQMDSIDPVDFEIGYHPHAGAPVVWTDKVRYNPVTDRKIDIRATGPLHSWRISTVDDGEFSITGVDIEYVNAGDR